MTSTTVSIFLKSDSYVDYESSIVRETCRALFQGAVSREDKSFPVRERYDEYVWEGIYVTPHKETVSRLESVGSIAEVIEQMPDDLNRVLNQEEAVA